MKVESYDKSRSGNRQVTFRTNAYELEIVMGLLQNALFHTPVTKQTKETRRRMQVMLHGFKGVDLDKMQMECSSFNQRTD